MTDTELQGIINQLTAIESKLIRANINLADDNLANADHAIFTAKQALRAYAKQTVNA